MKKIIKGIAVGLAAASLCCTAVAADPTQGMIATAIQLQEEYDLPSGLLLSVAEIESDFNPDCVTGKCKGLMQIHSSYASGFAKAAGMDSYDLLDYADSMRIGAYLLSDYMTRYEGDIHFTLMAYNLGEYGALARRRDGVESTGYSRKVISRMEKWSDATCDELFGNSEQLEADHIAEAGKMVSSIKAAVKKWMEDFVK